MREISIDLSHRQSNPTVFAGYEGEHNATQVTVVLPIEMANSKEITTFYPRFCTSCREDYVGEIIANAGNQKIIFKVHQAITRRGKTEIQIEGKDSEGNIIARSALGYLVFNPSVNNQGKELGLVINDDSLIKIQEEIQESVETAQESALKALNAVEEAKDEISAVNEGVGALSGEVSALKEDVDRLSPSPKEIYKAEGLYLSKIGGTETECCYGFNKNLQHNVELKANDEYIFSIPHSLVGNGEMSISIREIGIVKLKHNGDSYTGIYIPTKDVYTWTLYELIIYGASDFSSTIDLHIEHLSPMAKKFGDIDSALDGIISIQESLIGGDTQ